MRNIDKLFFRVKRISDWIEIAIKYIASLLIFLCAVCVFFQVVNRYILVKQTLFPWKSVPWTDEMSKLLMVILAFLCMGVCYKHGELSRADMVYSKLSGWKKKALYYIEFVCIVIFLVAAIIYGIKFANANKIFRTESLFIPGNVLYSIPVVGFILMLFNALVEFLGVISGNVEPFESVEKPEVEEE